ncbi:MAG: YbhB/YbcL family Raf kinase inhibitor-like protein [Bacteroidota bacterium]
MKLKTDAFEHEGMIPQKYTCMGEDKSPALKWEDIPLGTKSLALSLKDPDAPGKTFVHWLVYDIDPSTDGVKENGVPGKQVTNHFGRESYGGPCPPSGVHRYYFRLFALDVETLGEISSMDEFDQAVEKHTIDQAEIMGRFSK